MLEKALYWSCVAILILFGSLFCWGIVDAMTVGRIESVRKSGQGFVYLLEQNPVGFFATVAVHLLIAGCFWWFAFWVWRNRIKNETI